MRRLGPLAVAALLVLPLAGCRTAPIYNASGVPLPARPGAALTLGDVSQAIASAGRKLGWRMEEVRPGELTGTLALRKHRAVVAITHDTAKFDITYKASEMLRQEGDQIHRNYNNWIRNLEKAIQSEIALVTAR